LKAPVDEPVVAGKKDGCDTRELRYTAESDGMKMKYDVLYIFSKGKAHTLTAGTLAKYFTAAFEEDIKVFFTSFEFKEGMESAARARSPGPNACQAVGRSLLSGAPPRGRIDLHRRDPV
jgi:hypothetical protein